MLPVRHSLREPFLGEKRGEGVFPPRGDPESPAKSAFRKAAESGAREMQRAQRKGSKEGLRLGGVQKSL